MHNDAISDSFTYNYAVAKALGVDAKAVSKWLTGKSVPETVNLIKLANLADLSVDELLGQE